MGPGGLEIIRGYPFNKFDWLTPQDLYNMVIRVVEFSRGVYNLSNFCFQTNQLDNRTSSIEEAGQQSIGVIHHL